MWIFGPIPVFCTSLALVFMLYFLDVTFDSCPGVADTDMAEVFQLNRHHVDVEIGSDN